MPEVEPEHQIDPTKGLEAWQFTGRGKLYLMKYTGKYGVVDYVKIEGSRPFHLTPEERHMNSDAVKRVADDPFSNGTCVKIRLAGDTPPEDVAAIESNPLMMSEDDIVKMFKGQTVAVEQRLASIDNLVLLERIRDRAKSSPDLSQAKAALVEDRYLELVGGAVDEDGRVQVAAFNSTDMPEIYGEEFTGPKMGRRSTEVSVG